VHVLFYHLDTSLFRWLDGEKAPVPNVGDGDSALSKGLENIEKIYDRCLQDLYQVRQTILDSSDTSWNDNYQKFRIGVNETESLVENVLNEAFESVTSVKEGVEILDVFYQYTPRQRIRQVYEGKIERVYRKFNEQLQEVRRNLSFDNLTGLSDQPRYAGKIIWLNTLQTKINSTVNILQSASWFSVYGIMTVSKGEYKEVMHIINSQIEKVNKDWQRMSDKGASKKLEAYLLNSNLHLPGTIDINFDRNLIKLIKEVQVWVTYKFGIPGHIKAVYNKIGQTLILYKRIFKIVQTYNQIMSSLSAEEKGLFKERIRKIDKHIWQGKHQYIWLHSEVSEWLHISINMIEATFEALQNYKTINHNVQSLCKRIEMLDMIKIHSEEIINGETFRAQQTAHLATVQRIIQEQYSSIQKTVTKLKDDFSSSGTKVVEQWTKYEDKINERVALSMRKGIVNSLTLLAETISNSGKTGIMPVLKITVSLKDNKVCISPKLPSVLEMFCATQLSLISVAKKVGQSNEKWLEIINSLIEKDDEFQEIQQSIQNHVQMTINEVYEYIKTWEVYKDTWELNPDKLVTKYMETHPDTSAFDADIAKHKYLSKTCKKQEAQVWIGFMLVDCYPLQEGVVQQCDHWQEIFMELMKEMLHKTLSLIYGFLEESKMSSLIVPESVYDLKQSLENHSKIVKQIPTMESKFPEICHVSDILQKYKRDLPNEDAKKLNSLKENWKNFKEIIQENGVNLQSSKEKCKEELLSKSQDFERHVKNTVEEYTLSGPFGTSWKTDEAFKQLKVLKDKVNELSKIDREISEGLAVFSIHRELSKEMEELMNKLDILSLIWHMAEEWEEVHGKWQHTKILDAKIIDIEDNMTVMTNRLDIFNDKDLDNRWEIFSQVKYQIQSYDRNKHLIVLLVDKALRKRHWESILLYVKDANPNFSSIAVERDDIKIEDLTSMGFDKCISSIEDVILSAQKEIAIENELDFLAQKVWTTQIETDINKQDFCYIKNFNELFCVYRDAHSKLRDLKLSKYINPFGNTVEELEKDISIILSLIEKLETAEKNILDVKEIFSVYCVKKQLPREYRLLSDALEFWNDVISNVQADARIYKFSEQKILTQGINDLIISMEKIKEYLYPFLECRREQCHRLYVLTNEQLLKLLSSKTCQDLSVIIQKVFPNISHLTGGNRKDGSIMISKIVTFDGETIPYQSDPKGKESIENIILKIHDLLGHHVKSQIVNCLNNMKKGSKIEQIQKEYSWQAYDIARKIMFTSDLQKILETNSGSEQNMKLVELIRKSEENMEKIGRSLQQVSNARGKLKLINNNNTEFSIRLSLVMMQQHQIRNNIANCLSTLEWLSVCKYFYIKSRNEIIVSHGYLSYIYGSESLKMEEPIILYPRANEALMQMSSSNASFKCPVLCGLSETGKSSKIKAYSNILGRFLFTCQINENFPRESLHSVIKMISTNLFCINIAIKQSDPNLILLLAEELELLKSSIPDIFKNLCLFLSSDQFHRDFFNTLYRKRQIFRIIFDLEEVTSQLLDSKLAAESFLNFELLRARMGIMIRCFNPMFLGSDCHLTVTQLLNVIDSAVDLIKQDKNMLQEESIMQAFWMHFDKMSRYELSFPVHTAVKDLYPRLDIKMINTGPELDIQLLVKKFTSKNKLSFNNSLVNIVKVCWEKFNTSKCLILVGKSNMLKTTIIHIMLSILQESEKESSLVTQNISMSCQYTKHLLGQHSKTGKWQDGVLKKVLNENETSRVVLYFDGTMSDANIVLLNRLLKPNFPVSIPNNSRVVLQESLKIILEIPELSKNKLGELQHCSIVEIKDCSIDPFSLLDSHFTTSAPDVAIKAESKKYISMFMNILLTNCQPVVYMDQMICETNFLNLFQGLTSFYFEEDSLWKNNKTFIKKATFFCALWAVFSTIDSQDQIKVDNIIRKQGTDVPVYGTVFDYFIDQEMLVWEHWNKNVSEWSYDPEEPHSSFYIETIRYIKYEYLLKLLTCRGTHVLLLGPKGCGKTSIIKEYVTKYVKDDNHVISIQMCNNTKASHIFNSLYQFTEKKTKQEMQPINGKKLLVLLDDIDLKENSHIAEPLRFFTEKGRWIIQGEEKIFCDFTIIGSENMDKTSKPGSISRARKSFQYFYIDEWSTEETMKMYTTVLKGKFLDFEVNIKFLTQSIIKASISVYNSISSMFITDQNISTMFFTSDIKKVICGVLRSHKDCHDTKFEVVQLWVHEVLRTFRDRMINNENENKVVEIVREQTKKYFNLNFDSLCEDEEHWEPPLFGNILDTYGFYTDLDYCELLQYLSDKVNDYNSIDENPKLDIVFNRFVIQNIVRMLRVISEPEGHIIMSGESGNCRQSITRLSAFIYDMDIFVLSEIDVAEREIWWKCLRSIVRTTGLGNKKTLLFVALGSQGCDSFLRVLSTILSFGLDPMLFEKEEILAIERKRKSSGSNCISYKEICQNIIKNIHVVFSMNLNDPLTTLFFSKYRCLISKFVINHIKPYSTNDLEEMAKLFLEKNMTEEKGTTFVTLTRLFAKMYTNSKEFNIHHNKVDVLKPSSFYFFLEEFASIYKLKLAERKEMQDKLSKIFQNNKDVEQVIGDLYSESANAKSRLTVTQKAHDELLIQQMQLKRDHEDMQKKLLDEQKKASEEKNSFSQIEYSLKVEIEDLWYPVEKCKIQLKELTSEDEDMILEEIDKGRTKSPFLTAAAILFSSDQEFTENSFQQIMNGMTSITSEKFSESRLSSFVEFLAKNKPKQEIVNMVEKTYVKESIKQWCLAVEAFGKGKKSSNQKKLKCDQLKKRYESRQDVIAQVKSQVISLESDLESLEENLSREMKSMEKDSKVIEKIEQKIEKAEKVRRLLSQDMESCQIVHSQFQEDQQKILGHSILSSAALGYFGPFSSSQRKELMDCWKSFLKIENISFENDFDHKIFIAGSHVINQFKTVHYSQTEHMLENYLILQRKNLNNIIICIDPEDQATSVLSIADESSGTLVSHINDQYLKKNLVHALARGETLIIRNAENNYEHLFLPLVRKFFKKEQETVYIKCFGSLCHYNSKFKLRILVPSFTNIKLTLKVLVMNFQYEVSDLEIFFYNIISIKKLGPVYHQRREMFSVTSESHDASERSQLEVLNSLSLPLNTLLLEDKPLQVVNTIRENIHAALEKNVIHEQYLKTAEANLLANQPLAQYCAVLYIEITKLKKINSVYSLSLTKFVEILSLKEDDTDDTDENEAPKQYGNLHLNSDEHRILASLLFKMELTMKCEHFLTATLHIAVAICRLKEYVDDSAVVKFLLQVSKLSDIQAHTIINLLMPSLTESEAKVINTVMCTTENKDIIETIEEIPELNFLQQLSVVSVFSISAFVNFAKRTTSRLLDITHTGKSVFLYLSPTYFVRIITVFLPEASGGKRYLKIYLKSNTDIHFTWKKL